MGGQRLTIDLALGARVRTARLASDLPQSSLAALLGLSSGQVARLEAGEERISSEQLTEIAAALGQTISYFFQNWNLGVARPLYCARLLPMSDTDPDGLGSSAAEPYLQ